MAVFMCGVLMDGMDGFGHLPVGVFFSGKHDVF